MHRLQTCIIEPSCDSIAMMSQQKNTQPTDAVFDPYDTDQSLPNFEVPQVKTETVAPKLKHAQEKTNERCFYDCILELINFTETHGLRNDQKSDMHSLEYTDVSALQNALAEHLKTNYEKFANQRIENKMKRQIEKRKGSTSENSQSFTKTTEQICKEYADSIINSEEACSPSADSTSIKLTQDEFYVMIEIAASLFHVVICTWETFNPSPKYYFLWNTSFPDNFEKDRPHVEWNIFILGNGLKKYLEFNWIEPSNASVIQSPFGAFAYENSKTLKTWIDKQKSDAKNDLWNFVQDLQQPAEVNKQGDANENVFQKAFRYLFLNDTKTPYEAELKKNANSLIDALCKCSETCTDTNNVASKEDERRKFRNSLAEHLNNEIIPDVTKDKQREKNIKNYIFQDMNFLNENLKKTNWNAIEWSKAMNDSLNSLATSYCENVLQYEDDKIAEATNYCSYFACRIAASKFKKRLHFYFEEDDQHIYYQTTYNENYGNATDTSSFQVPDWYIVLKKDFTWKNLKDMHRYKDKIHRLQNMQRNANSLFDCLLMLANNENMGMKSATDLRYKLQDRLLELIKEAEGSQDKSMIKLAKDLMIEHVSLFLTLQNTGSLTTIKKDSKSNQDSKNAPSKRLTTISEDDESIKIYQNNRAKTSTEKLLKEVQELSFVKNTSAQTPQTLLQPQNWGTKLFCFVACNYFKKNICVFTTYPRQLDHFSPWHPDTSSNVSQSATNSAWNLTFDYANYRWYKSTVAEEVLGAKYTILKCESEEEKAAEEAKKAAELKHNRGVRLGFQDKVEELNQESIEKERKLKNQVIKLQEEILRLKSNVELLQQTTNSPDNLKESIEKLIQQLIDTKNGTPKQHDDLKSEVLELLGKKVVELLNERQAQKK